MAPRNYRLAVLTLAITWMLTTCIQSKPATLDGNNKKGDAILAKLWKLEAQLRDKADHSPTVSWRSFAAAQAAGQDDLDGCRVELYAADFAAGTLVVDRPAYLVLMEDVALAPNPETDFLPQPGQEPFYSSDAFQLGFFAGLVLTGQDIVLDLDGHHLGMSTDFLLMQRFFALIETASQPFVPEQGPANFGPNIKSCQRCIIKNGSLGPSSHHGIHGNGNDQVFVHDIVAKGYEVAGITFGGLTNSAIVDVDLQGTRTDVWVDGTFSHARFSTNTLLSRVIPKLPPAEAAELGQAVAPVVELMSQARREILASGQLTSAATQAVFENTALPDGRRVIDGTSYGLSLNILGAITDTFLASNSRHVGELANVVVRRVRVANTVSKIEEAVGLRVGPAVDSPPNVGMEHEIFRILEWQADGRYVPNVVAAMDLKLLQMSDPGNGTSASLKALRAQPFGLKEFNMSSDVLQWAQGTLPYAQLTKDRLVCNVDTQGHSLKGNIGLFISGGVGIYVTDVVVRNTANYGVEENAAICKAEDPAFKKYLGADSYGVAVVASQEVQLVGVTVDGVSAENRAYGIRIFNGSKDVCLKRWSVSRTDQPPVVVGAKSRVTKRCSA